MSHHRQRIFRPHHWVIVTALVMAIAYPIGIYQGYWGWASTKIVVVPAQGTALLDFSFERDMPHIRKIFTTERYWLITSDEYNEDKSVRRKHYDEEQTFLRANPHYYDPRDDGKLTTKVLYVDGQFAGFISYDRQNFYAGHILFLATDPAFRGKGYAHKLLNYAFDDLIGRGCNVVRLMARTDNAIGRRTYEANGFKEYRQNVELGQAFFERKP